MGADRNENSTIKAAAARIMASFSISKFHSLWKASPQIHLSLPAVPSLLSVDPGPHTQVFLDRGSEAIKFVTSEGLVTVKGTSISAGGYTTLRVPYPAQWTLITNERYGSLPMPLTRLLAGRKLQHLLDHHGASCAMCVSWENPQLSLEFASEESSFATRTPCCTSATS